MHQYSAPLLIDRKTDLIRATPLERIAFAPAAADPHRFEEDWVQRLVHEHPQVLPINEIEPAFAGLRAVCRELPMAAGYVDNLLVAPNGLICIVECKLWRNPAARREVVGQVLDYGAELATWSYDGLIQAIRRATPKSEDPDPLFTRVIGTTAGDASFERAEFIDAVSRSLRQGNFLLLVVGDGIRTETRNIADLLQRRASLGFSFSLIEMAAYRHPGEAGPIYVQPRVLLRTEIITRAVAQLEAQARLSVRPPTPESLTETLFYEKLAGVDPKLASGVRDLVEKCRALGCRTVLRQTMTIYVEDPNGLLWNLAAIDKDGRVVIWGIAARDERYDVSLGEQYLLGVATLLPGAQLIKGSVRSDWKIQVNGRAYFPATILLDHATAWLEVVERTAEAIRRLGAA